MNISLIVVLMGLSILCVAVTVFIAFRDMHG